MSTDDIKEHFSHFWSEEKGADSIIITWINDSSCRVTFESPEIASKAFKLSSLSTNT